MVLLIGILFIVFWFLVFPPSLPDVSVLRAEQAQSLRSGHFGLRGNRTKTVSAHRGVWRMPDLSQRRVWFAEDDGDGGAGAGAGATDDINLESLDPAVRKYISTLKTQLDEVKHESIGRRKYIERIEAENEAMTSAKRKELEADGKYKDLYQQELDRVAELTLKAERAEAYEMQIKAANEANIAKIPETYRDVVPDLPPDRLSVWLATNMSKFTTPDAPDINAGDSTGGGKPVTLTAEEEIAFKSGGWESKEQYLEYKKRAGV